jgi:hypothetical protein
VVSRGSLRQRSVQQQVIKQGWTTETSDDDMNRQGEAEITTRSQPISSILVLSVWVSLTALTQSHLWQCQVAW